ncbi:MAG: DUF2167 domain-containing protein [Paracoccaceae bacterium]
MKKFLKENVIFLVISFLCFSMEPAVLLAQSGGIDPRPFTQPLSLSRGVLVSGDDAALYLTKDDYCEIVLYEWGWDECASIDAMTVQPFAGTDTVIVSKPNTDGYVKLDDWDSAERKSAVREIELSLAEGMRAQGEKLGQDLRFIGWRTQPTLNKEKKYLYYATDSSWNGAPVTNITATVFDRKGFVEFSIVPDRDDLTSAEVENMINSVLDLYTPKQKESYSEFVTGDNVAAVGAIGVLAGLVGVKYGKAAATGLFALGVLLLKKFYFLLLIPLLGIGKLFKR